MKRCGEREMKRRGFTVGGLQFQVKNSCYRDTTSETRFE